MALTRRGKVVTGLGIAAGVLGMVVLGGLFYLRSLGVWGPSHPGKTVPIVIPKGTSASQVGKLLADKGVIDSAMGWRLRIFLDGGAPSIEAGRYAMHIGLSAADALRFLTGNGPLVRYVPVTFPEGSTLEQVAEIVGSKTKISRKDFLRQATSGKIRSRYEPRGTDSLEGLVFPSTYQVIGRDTAESLVKRLVATFDKTFSSMDLSETRKMGLSPYQAIIVASMVEEEARVDADRGKIARVIYNRLEANMPLGIDATIEYVLHDHAAELTRSDLQIDSPYNTRTHTGLPPTPIAAAGKASLEAALHPSGGKWLYYVVKDCRGDHAFSTSYGAFLKNKAHYESLRC